MEAAPRRRRPRRAGRPPARKAPPPRTTAARKPAARRPRAAGRSAAAPRRSRGGQGRQRDSAAKGTSAAKSTAKPRHPALLRREVRLHPPPPRDDPQAAQLLVTPPPPSPPPAPAELRLQPLTPWASSSPPRRIATVMDRVFSRMRRGRGNGTQSCATPKCRSDSSLRTSTWCVDIRAAATGEERQPALGVDRRRRLGAEGEDGRCPRRPPTVLQGEENVPVALARGRSSPAAT